MAVKLLYNDIHQFADGNGVPYPGAKIFTYAAGSSTKQTTYTDSGGVTPNTNPIVLDSAGRTPQPIWLTTGLSYKLVLAPSTDTDPPVSPIWTLDAVTGINDASTSVDEWTASGLTPTYVSGTSFTLAGDQTVAFHKGRRVKVTDAGGTKYGTIVSSVFGALTTVTIALDAAATLSNPTSAVSYSVLTSVDPGVSADMIYKKGTAVAAAATTDIWSIVGDYIHITGAGGPITSFGTAPYAGDERTLIFDSTPQVTQNATTLQLPGGVSVTMAAGDRMTVRADTTVNMIVTNITRAAGTGNNLPCGRLTLTTAVPVTTADVTAATTVYYTPYNGNTVPIYNGTAFVDTPFTELSQLTTDATKSPAAVGNNLNYDVFVWNDAGTLRATRGPAWSTALARGAGAGTTELQLVNGIYTNKVAITNGPGAGLGTYVGSIRSNGSAQINDSLLLRGVFNAFNRLDRKMVVTEATDSWNYTIQTWRQARATATNQVSAIVGLSEDLVQIHVQCPTFNAGGAVSIAVGVGVDSTTVNSADLMGSFTGTQSSLTSAEYKGYPGIGWHDFPWLEISAATGTTTWYGDNGVTFWFSGMIGTVKG